jgi:hypothetical protein
MILSINTGTWYINEGRLLAVAGQTIMVNTLFGLNKGLTVYKIIIIVRDGRGTWVVSCVAWLMLGTCLMHVLIHLYIQAENRTFS